MSRKKTKKDVHDWFYDGMWVKYKPHCYDPSKDHYKFGLVIDYEGDVLLYENEEQKNVFRVQVPEKEIENFFEPMDEIDTPYKENTNETFRFIIGVWNVQIARSLIHKDRVTLDVTQDWIASNYNQMLKHIDQDNDNVMLLGVHIEKEHALSDNCDLNNPIIITTSIDKSDNGMRFFEEHGKYRLMSLPIDGWHRIYKAYHQNSTLKAYVMHPEENEIIRLH